jgi:hypothetical protein
MKKVNEMIEAYNKKAEKWGYKKIEIIDGKIGHEFDTKPENEGSLFKKMGIVYKNGYMKGDYEKIKKALN